MHKLKTEVDTIANYFLVLERYLYPIDDYTFGNFWLLREGPKLNKDAMEEANRIIQ